MPWNPSGFQPDGWGPTDWHNEEEGAAAQVPTDIMPASAIVTPAVQNYISRAMPLLTTTSRPRG